MFQLVFVLLGIFSVNLSLAYNVETFAVRESFTNLQSLESKLLVELRGYHMYTPASWAESPVNHVFTLIITPSKESLHENVILIRFLSNETSGLYHYKPEGPKSQTFLYRDTDNWQFEVHCELVQTFTVSWDWVNNDVRNTFYLTNHDGYLEMWDNFDKDNSGKLFSWKADQPLDKSYFSMHYNQGNRYKLEANIIKTEIFDVYTVYDVSHTSKVKNVEIHARTNAKGLPFNVNGKTIDATIGRDFSACQYSQMSGDIDCPWTNRGWIWQGTASSLYLNRHRVRQNITTLFSEMFLAPSKLSVQLKPNYLFNYPGVFRIYSAISPHKEYLIRNLNDFYYVFTVGNYYNYLYICHTEIKSMLNNISDTDGKQVTLPCQKEVEWVKTRHFPTTIHFFLEMSPGRVRLFDNFHSMEPVLDWEGFPDFQPSYMSLSQNDGNFSTAIFSSPDLLPTGSNMLTSPWFKLRKTVICITLVFYTEDLSNEVKIEMERKDKTNEPCEFIGRIQPKKNGWQIERLSKKIHQSNGSHEDIRLVVSVSSYLRPGTFRLQRISSCNVEGDDVAILKENTMGDMETKRNSFKNYVAYNLDLPTAVTDIPSLFKEPYINGGVRVDSHYICPVGFTGYKCREANGANDSDALKGKLYCIPGLGCSCASGLTGSTCEENCEEGKYGANCTEVCGDCLEGACNIYTGHCKACKPGFDLPYCNSNMNELRIP